MRLAVSILVAVSAVTLAACGGSDDEAAVPVALAQRFLTAKDPGFTARTYVHLDASDLPDPAIFDTYFDPPGGNDGATRPTEATRDAGLRDAVI
jgi:hypothetical protein